ncbi:MAG: dUTP diphosphatase [Nanoarchaeota archaeon]
MEQPYLKIKKVKKEAIIPSKRVEDACFDIYAVFEEDPIFLYPGDIKLINTGISTQFPKDWVFYIVEKSSTGIKGISTRAGVIDSGYRGEIKTPLNNTTNKLIILTNKTQEEILEKYSDKILNYKDNFVIHPQNKSIAQGFLLYCPHVDIEEVDKLDMESQRKDGGFGSTQK